MNDSRKKQNKTKRLFYKPKKGIKSTQSFSIMILPQIFIGASSSRRFGWLRKISFDVTQSIRISASVNCTCLGVRPFFASTSRLMMSSNNSPSISDTQTPQTLASRKLFLSLQTQKRKNSTTQRNPIPSHY